MKITKDSQLTLIELPATQFGILNGELAFDEFSMFTSRLPSRALPTLEGALREQNWQNVQSIYPLHHGKKGKLTPANLDRIFSSDLLLISSITRTAPQSIELVRRYKQANPQGIVIAGGPDPTFRYEDWLSRGADVVVFGEGDRTLVELTERLLKDDDLSDIKGIAFKNPGITKTQDKDFLTPEEFSHISHPYYFTINPIIYPINITNNPITINNIIANNFRDFFSLSFNFFLFIFLFAIHLSSQSQI
jgi:radical SAM superfamily enzyme YgiQ (UPF0313 family)